MKVLVSITVAILLFQFEVVGVKAQDFDPVLDVAEVMSDLLRPAPNRPLYKNPEELLVFAEDITWASKARSVPEFLLTVQVFKESSFRTDALAKDRPTYGLGQVHGVAAKGCNLKTRRGQLDCTAKWLKFCRKRCGTWEGALTAYATTGYCSVWEMDTGFEKKLKLWKSINKRMRMWLKYEYQRERIRAEIIDDIEHYAAQKEATDLKQN